MRRRPRVYSFRRPPWASTAIAAMRSCVRTAGQVGASPRKSAGSGKPPPSPQRRAGIRTAQMRIWGGDERRWRRLAENAHSIPPGPRGEDGQRSPVVALGLGPRRGGRDSARIEPRIALRIGQHRSAESCDQCRVHPHSGFGSDGDRRFSPCQPSPSAWSSERWAKNSFSAASAWSQPSFCQRISIPASGFEECAGRDFAALMLRPRGTAAPGCPACAARGVSDSAKWSVARRTAGAAVPKHPQNLT